MIKEKKDLGLSNRAIADDLNISASTVSRYLKKKPYCLCAEHKHIMHSILNLVIVCKVGAACLSYFST